MADESVDAIARKAMLANEELFQALNLWDPHVQQDIRSWLLVDFDVANTTDWITAYYRKQGHK